MSLYLIVSRLWFRSLVIGCRHSKWSLVDSKQLREAARRRLDQRFQRAAIEHLVARPRLGWVRAIRDALGMSTRQLASRMGVSQPTVVQLEQSEVNGRIQLATLRRAAEALDCDLVYALVPRNGSLEQTVLAQASGRARALVRAVDRSMELEDQAVTDPDETEAAVNRVALQLVASRRLWDQ
jgi:predicted DNA-binding mobile mystery protein A